MGQAHVNQQELIGQFLVALRSLPDVQARLVRASLPGIDAQLALDVAGNPVHGLVKVRKAVFPRDARQFVWWSRNLAVKPLVGKSGGEALAVLVAESISPAAKQLLQDERVGYFDSGGSLYLPARAALLYVDRPPPKSLSRNVRTLFNGRRAQVLHGLLVRHESWFGVKEIAEQALVAPATASEVLTELERYDWLESRGQGPGKQRHLRDPAALLDAWAKQLSAMKPPAMRRYFVPSMNVDELAERLGQVCERHRVEYAVSFEAAAQRYAPFLSAISQVRCRLLAGPESDAVIADLGARVVNEGANLAVIEAKSAGDLLFRERVGGLWLASPIEVYLDLLRGEGRAKEMAEHLRRERIGF